MRRPFGERVAAPCALAVDVQHAGRGRNGRGWLSAGAGRSIALSVALERETDGASLLGLPLAVGVAVVDVLAAHGARPRLKWPNDLLVAGADGVARKAGGLLVEVRQQGALQRVVAGVGLNLAASDAISDANAGQPVGALFEPASMPAREPLEHALSHAIARVLHTFARTGLAPWRARWRALDALADAPVDVLRADGSRTPGIARGIDDDGALRVERADGAIERLVSGEVGVRPRGLAR